MAGMSLEVTITAPDGAVERWSCPVDDPNDLVLALYYAAVPAAVRLRDLPGDPYGLRDVAERLDMLADHERGNRLGEGVRAERFDQAMRQMLDGDDEV